MINYIIIFFTQSTCEKDFFVIDKTMTSIIKWTQDLEDCDKVLRVVSSRDISSWLLEKFREIGFKAELMAVYQGDQLGCYSSPIPEVCVLDFNQHQTKELDVC